MKDGNNGTDVTSSLKIEDLAVLRGAGLVLGGSGSNGPKIVVSSAERLVD
jgi:hypothetical protein